MSWRWNFLAYGLWISGAFLLWLLDYGSQAYLPAIARPQMGDLPVWITIPNLQAIIVWLAFQMVLPDRRLPWIIAFTLLGSFLGSFLERYIYVFAYHYFQLIPGNTVRQMFLSAIVSVLVPGVITAILQMLFLGPILKRLGWSFALTWIAASIIAGIVAPTISVLTELSYYSPSHFYPLLIKGIVAGAITGLPLIWLRTPQTDSEPQHEFPT